MNTTEWSKEDHELYAKWVKQLGGDMWTAFGAEECLMLVEDEGILPTEVGEVQHNRSHEAYR